MEREREFTVVEVFQNRSGEIRKRNFGRTTDITRLKLEMMRLVSADSYGLFEKNGFSKTNHEYRTASGFRKTTGFVEYMVMSYIDWLGFANKPAYSGSKFEIPADFNFNAVRLQEKELCVYYRATLPLIKRWCKETGVTVSSGKRSNVSMNPACGKNIPDDFEALVNRMGKHALAAHYNVSPGTVYRWCRYLDIDVKPARRRYYKPDDFADVCKNLYSEQSIAEHYRVPVTIVRSWRDDEYLPVNARISMPEDFANKAKILNNKFALGQYYCVSKYYINNWLRQCGIVIESEHSGKCKKIPDGFVDLAKTKNCSELAKIFHISDSTAWKWKTHYCN